MFSNREKESKPGRTVHAYLHIIYTGQGKYLCKIFVFYVVSRYRFLREIRVRVRRKVVEDVSENQISNSERESKGLQKPMRRSGGGPKVPRVGRASVYLVRAGTKWNMCA